MKKTEKVSIEDVSKQFLEDYKQIVDKHGLQLAATPKFMQRDDGTFSVVIELVLIPTQKKV